MNDVYEQYLASVRGLPLEFHLRFHDRVVAAISRYVPEEHIEEAVENIRYHRGEMYKIFIEDSERERYAIPLHDRLRIYRENESFLPQALNTF